MKAKNYVLFVLILSVFIIRVETNINRRLDEDNTITDIINKIYFLLF